MLVIITLFLVILASNVVLAPPLFVQFLMLLLVACVSIALLVWREKHKSLLLRRIANEKIMDIRKNVRKQLLKSIERLESFEKDFATNEELNKGSSDDILRQTYNDRGFLKEVSSQLEVILEQSRESSDHDESVSRLLRELRKFENNVCKVIDSHKNRGRYLYRFNAMLTRSLLAVYNEAIYKIK